MARLIFSIVWTAAALGGVALIARDGAGAMLAFPAVVYVTVFPLFGVMAILLSLHDIRRRRTLRQVTENGVTVWVWIGLNGAERRAEADPVPDWDSADGDGGDGGD
ncbi:MAG: hypothetical protein ACK4TB_18095 [Gemmobacter sp.]